MFGPTQANGYRSSTTGAGDPFGAWDVFFSSGLFVFFDDKMDTAYVRAVRGGL